MLRAKAPLERNSIPTGSEAKFTLDLRSLRHKLVALLRDRSLGWRQATVLFKVGWIAGAARW
jgi:hypothetical protein